MSATSEPCPGARRRRRRDHPLNYPIEVILNKLGPALAMGNSVILKPDPNTPWNATRLGRIIAEHTDIPPGVVNVVPTPANDVAARLVLDPRVDMVSFTGSTAVGKQITRDGAEHHEANLPGAGRQVGTDRARGRQAVTRHPGCGRGVCARRAGLRVDTRLLIHQSLYDEAVADIRMAFEAVPVGDPALPGDILRAGGERRTEAAGAGRLLDGAP